MARTPLSIDWTLVKARGIIRVLVDELSGHKIVDTAIDNMIHLSLCGVVSQLGEAVENDYIELETPVTQTSNVIDVKAIRIDKIVKIVDATNGLVVEKGAKEFEGAKLIDQNKKSIFWTRRGNNIDIWKGSSITSYGTLSLFYKTRPIEATADTTKLDISDDYMDIVITKAKILVYETLDKQVPQSLENNYQTLITGARNAAMGESAQVKTQ